MSSPAAAASGLAATTICRAAWTEELAGGTCGGAAQPALRQIAARTAPCHQFVNVLRIAAPYGSVGLPSIIAPLNPCCALHNSVVSS
jgi:hypothetical protein